MAQNKILLGILILLNALVLMGEIRPDMAPPFAHVVRIIFLTATLIVFVSLFLKRRKHI